MKTKFTKASRTDGTLVTVNLVQFDGSGGLECLRRDWLTHGSTLQLIIDGQEVIFRVNRVRNGLAATATTHCFPRYLRLPQIGRPVSAEVTEVF